jgi:hypothetical protein
MTPAERDALIARAKFVAPVVVKCVEGRLSPGHITRKLSREEIEALVLVLADAVDPVRLRVVVSADEDGPDVTDRDLLLRRAHADAKAYRRDGKPVPEHVRRLDNEYHERGKLRRTAA